MTEYWVSQGNKWCDFCKIYISNNPLSIRTHEMGQRHKDTVTKRLSTMRKESAAREKEHKDAERALKQIEAKAKRSYQKDLASFSEANNSSSHSSEPQYGTPVIGEKLTLKTAPASQTSSITEDETASKCKGGRAPGLIISTPLNPMRFVKGAPSSTAVNKRKRVDEKTKVISKEEDAALKAREAAKKRVEEREKPMLGLYR